MSTPSPSGDPAAAAGARTGRAGWLSAVTLRSAVVAAGLGTAAAVALNPVFVTPFPVLLGRALFLAMVLLVVYALAGQWPRRWLPSWMPRDVVRVVAVALAVPVATFGTYLLSVGGDLESFFSAEGRVIGYLLTTSVGLAVGLVITFAALLRERDAQERNQALRFELERSVLEKQALDARLSLLQAQIEPHFLFNTLANVQALVEDGSPRAAGVLKSLIAYLRAALPRLHDGQPTLGNEVDLVRAYLELMQMRMPDRLRFRLAVDSALGTQRFPAMALLTLVENAVRHGIDPSEDGGHIDIGADRRADALHVWVTDTGVGLSPHARPGTGITNLRDRLQAFFGSGADVHWSEVAPHGLRAEIVVPQATP